MSVYSCYKPLYINFIKGKNQIMLKNQILILHDNLHKYVKNKILDHS